MVGPSSKHQIIVGLYHQMCLLLFSCHSPKSRDQNSKAHNLSINKYHFFLISEHVLVCFFDHLNQAILFWNFFVSFVLFWFQNNFKLEQDYWNFFVNHGYLFSNEYICMYSYVYKYQDRNSRQEESLYEGKLDKQNECINSLIFWQTYQIH